MEKKSLFSGETKSYDQEYYYWYNDEIVDLTINKDFVNILVDTSIVKESSLPDFCSEYSLVPMTKLDNYGLFKAEIKEGKTSNSTYQSIVEALREDTRVHKVLPYFERGHGADPIGTSHLFYVQLKDISPEGTNYIDRIYETEALDKIAKQLNVRIEREVPYMPDWYIMSIEDSEFKTSVEAANRFFETGVFEAVDPAFMFNFQPSATNDPLFSQQWGLNNTSNPGYDINVEGAWSITTGSGVNIAIVDKGPDPYHSDLASNYHSSSYDARHNSFPADYDPAFYHGTYVTGIAAAVGNNNHQIAGVAYSSKIIRVSHDLDTSNPTISSELASGITWAWNEHADVINNSWGDHGGTYYNSIHSSILEGAIVNAMNCGRADKGSVVVFSAGNFGIFGAVMSYPANWEDRIIAVGSMNKSGYRSFDSGYGIKLDVVAPGDHILTTSPNSAIDTVRGTSIAVPHVSGIAALVLAANPNLSSDNVASIIQRTAKKISPNNIYSYSPRNYYLDSDTWNQEVGCGLVDATAAVTMAQALPSVSSLYGTGMDVMLSSGPTNNYHSYTLSGGSSPHTAYANLLYPQVNSAYTYYWFVSTNAYASWKPKLTFTSGSMAIIDIPAVSYPSTLYIQCLIYNGSTLVDIPSYTIYVNP